MQVITVSKFGGPEVMQVTDAELPKPGPGEVLVRVLAAGVGPWDVTLRRGGKPADQLRRLHQETRILRPDLIQNRSELGQQKKPLAVAVHKQLG